MSLQSDYDAALVTITTLTAANEALQAQIDILAPPAPTPTAFPKWMYLLNEANGQKFAFQCMNQAQVDNLGGSWHES